MDVIRIGALALVTVVGCSYPEASFTSGSDSSYPSDTTANDVLVADTDAALPGDANDETSGECPPAVPTNGDVCKAPQTCKYPSAGCEIIATCDGTGRWAVSGCTDNGPPVTPCPDKLPADGDACTPEGRVCGYSSDPRPGCRPYASCSVGTWHPTTPTCAGLPGGDPCPTTLAAASGIECPASDGEYCIYAEGVCLCTVCGAAGPGGGGPCGPGSVLRFRCDYPPGTCPKHLPNLGTLCAKDGQLCVYGTCGTDSLGGRLCSGGVWVNDVPPCPA